VFALEILDDMLQDAVVDIFSQLCYRKALYPCFLRFHVSSDYIFIVHNTTEGTRGSFTISMIART
jgi:hypothetical protein